jgi:hypothetical protein
MDSCKKIILSETWKNFAQSSTIYLYTTRYTKEHINCLKHKWL